MSGQEGRKWPIKSLRTKTKYKIFDKFLQRKICANSSTKQALSKHGAEWLNYVKAWCRMIKLNSLIKAVIFEWQKLCGKNYGAKIMGQK